MNEFQEEVYTEAFEDEMQKMAGTKKLIAATLLGGPVGYGAVKGLRATKKILGANTAMKKIVREKLVSSSKKLNNKLKGVSAADIDAKIKKLLLKGAMN